MLVRVVIVTRKRHGYCSFFQNYYEHYIPDCENKLYKIKD